MELKHPFVGGPGTLAPRSVVGIGLGPVTNLIFEESHVEEVLFRGLIAKKQVFKDQDSDNDFKEKVGFHKNSRQNGKIS